MAKSYGLKFGAGDPRANTGLSPTFLLFYSPTTGQTAIPPGISELLTGSGIYNFTYGPTTAVEFLAFGGGALSATDAYITGILDPVQAVDQQVGQSTDSFGSTNVDPTSLFGHAKRRQEWDEGAASYNKGTALWDVYSRGASTLLQEKQLTNSSSAATKN